MSEVKGEEMEKCCANCDHFSFVTRDHKVQADCDRYDIEGVIIDAFEFSCTEFEMVKEARVITD